jgi:hypothetical protein
MRCLVHISFHKLDGIRRDKQRKHTPHIHYLYYTVYSVLYVGAYRHSFPFDLRLVRTTDAPVPEPPSIADSMKTHTLLFLRLPTHYTNSIY